MNENKHLVKSQATLIRSLLNDIEWNATRADYTAIMKEENDRMHRMLIEEVEALAHII